MSLNRDSLYRECALHGGFVVPRGTEGNVDRCHGGAWVVCEVYVSNQEVSELLSRERKERRLEANERVEEGRHQGLDARELAELQDTPRRGDV